MKLEKEVKTIKIANIKKLKLYDFVYKGDMLNEVPSTEYIDIEYDNFPIFINDNSSMWDEGNEYLLSLLKDGKFPSQKSLRTIANKLFEYKQFVDENNYDCFEIEDGIDTPLRAYYQELQNKIYQQQLSSINSAKNRMKPVINMYDYFTENKIFTYDFPLYFSEKINKGIKNKKTGVISYYKTRKIDLLQFKDYKKPKKLIQMDYIEDDGKLFPLNTEEQIILIDALKNIGNTEMLLGHLLSLYTSGRIQTIFTLRIGNFMDIPNESDGVMVVSAGGNSLVDSKFNKPTILDIPIWIYTMIQQYVNSVRAQKRYQKAKNKLGNSEKQYLFITSQGNPFYSHRDDPIYSKKTNPPEGAAIRTFISNTLKAYYQKNNLNFQNFHFHNLRASYGQNYIQNNYYRVENGDATENDLISELAILMNHEDKTITKQYIKRRIKEKIATTIELQHTHNDIIKEKLNGY